MSITFIQGKYTEQGRAWCYKYLKDKYREKLNKGK